MKISVDGLVIWEKKTGEADKVISILTPGGVITAYAKGALRPKSRLASSTAMLSYSNFELFSGKNMYTVDDASAKTRFIRLETDVIGYALAAYFCELQRELAPTDENAAEFLILMLNALYVINEGKKDLNIVKSAFEMRIMSIAGYQPDLFGCSGCGVEDADPLFFDLMGGRWLCENCAAGERMRPNCGGAFLMALRHIILGDPKRIFSFSLPPKVAKEFSDFTSSYVTVHIDKKLKTLEFYNSISQ